MPLLIVYLRRHGRADVDALELHVVLALRLELGQRHAVDVGRAVVVGDAQLQDRAALVEVGRGRELRVGAGVGLVDAVAVEVPLVADDRPSASVDSLASKVFGLPSLASGPRQSWPGPSGRTAGRAGDGGRLSFGRVDDRRRRRRRSRSASASAVAAWRPSPTVIVRVTVSVCVVVPMRRTRSATRCWPAREVVRHGHRRAVVELVVGVEVPGVLERGGGRVLGRVGEASRARSRPASAA